MLFALFVTMYAKSRTSFSYAPSTSVIHHLIPWMLSIISIRGCHPWMTITYGRAIHGWQPRMEEQSMDDILRWHFHPRMTSSDDTFIHGWHPPMTLSSMDDISPSMDDIHRWYFHPWMRFLHPCHPWMEKCHPWMKVSSVDVIHE